MNTQPSRRAYSVPAGAFTLQLTRNVGMKTLLITLGAEMKEHNSPSNDDSKSEQSNWRGMVVLMVLAFAVGIHDLATGRSFIQWIDVDWLPWRLQFIEVEGKAAFLSGLGSLILGLGSAGWLIIARLFGLKNVAAVLIWVCALLFSGLEFAALYVGLKP